MSNDLQKTNVADSKPVTVDDVRKARQGGRMGQPPAIDAQRMMP